MLNEAFTHIRGTPTLLGWCPTRRWHVIRQQFVHTPAMIRARSGHGRRRCVSGTETCMRGTKVIHGANQIHPVLQGHHAACQCPPSTRQRGQAFAERRIQPFDIRRVDPPFALQATPARLDACRAHSSTMRRSTSTTQRYAYLFTTCRHTDIAPRTQPRTPQRPGMDRVAKGLANRLDIGVVACEQDDVSLQTATLFDQRSLQTRKPLG